MLISKKKEHKMVKPKKSYSPPDGTGVSITRIRVRISADSFRVTVSNRLIREGVTSLVLPTKLMQLLTRTKW